MKYNDEQELSEIKLTKQAAPKKSSEEKVQCKYTKIFKSETETQKLTSPSILVFHRFRITKTTN